MFSRRDPARPREGSPLPVHRLGGGGAAVGARERFVALIEGEDAPLLPVTIPQAIKGAAREAVALRQIRDRLGAEADALDLRPVALSAAGVTHVLAIDRRALAERREELARIGGQAVALLPDYLALPAQDGAWRLVIEPSGRVIARLGAAEGFSAEAGLAAALLREARQRLAAPQRLEVSGAMTPEIAEAVEGLQVIAAADADRPIPSFTREVLALDLRRGSDLERVALEDRLRAWVWPLLFAGLGLGAWIGAMSNDLTQLRHERIAIQDATEAVLRGALIPSGPILDIRQQVARRLDAARAAGEARNAPLDALARVSAGMAEAGVVPEEIALGGGQVRLLFRDSAAAERARADLEAQNLAFEQAGAELIWAYDPLEGGQ